MSPYLPGNLGFLQWSCTASMEGNGACLHLSTRHLHPICLPRCRDSVEGSEADLLLGGSPRSDRTFMSTRDKVRQTAH